MGQLTQHNTQQAERQSALTVDLTVADVLARWPQTVPVFLRYRLACVGCSLCRFEQIADVAATYGLNLDRFLHDLRQAAGPESEKNLQ